MTSSSVQGMAMPVIASKTNSRSNTEYEYTSISIFAKMELGSVGKRRTVSRRCEDGGGVVDGWNVRFAD